MLPDAQNCLILRKKTHQSSSEWKQKTLTIRLLLEIMRCTAASTIGKSRLIQRRNSH